jgi:ribulose 1,5-bisphosphate synthetase/thiazole synthase
MRSGYIPRRLNNRKQGSPKTRDGGADYTDIDVLQRNNKHAEAVCGVIAPRMLNLNGQYVVDCTQHSASILKILQNANSPADVVNGGPRGTYARESETFSLEVR